jgi:hypothetical protein
MFSCMGKDVPKQNRRLVPIFFDSRNFLHALGSRPILPEEAEVVKPRSFSSIPITSMQYCSESRIARLSLRLMKCLEASGHQQIEFEKSRDFAIDSR